MLSRLGVPAKKDFEKAVKADAGGDLVLSGWPKARFGARYDLEGGAMVVRPTPRAGGPTRVLESGRKPGKVPKGKGGRRGMAFNRTLRTPWGPRTFSNKAPMSTGRTRGKGTWTDATELMQSTVDEMLPDFILDKVGEILG